MNWLTASPLNQLAAAWRDEQLGTCSDATIGSDGCLITDFSLLAGVTPVTMNDAMKNEKPRLVAGAVVGGAWERLVGARSPAELAIRARGGGFGGGLGRSHDRGCELDFGRAPIGRVGPIPFTIYQVGVAFDEDWHAPIGVILIAVSRWVKRPPAVSIYASDQFDLACHFVHLLTKRITQRWVNVKHCCDTLTIGVMR